MEHHLNWCTAVLQRNIFPCSLDLLQVYSHREVFPGHSQNLVCSGEPVSFFFPFFSFYLLAQELRNIIGKHFIFLLIIFLNICSKNKSHLVDFLKIYLLIFFSQQLNSASVVCTIRRFYVQVLKQNWNRATKPPSFRMNPQQPSPPSSSIVKVHFKHPPLFLPPPPPLSGNAVSSAAVEPVIANTNWYRRLSPEERVHGQGTAVDVMLAVRALFTFHLNIFLSPIPGFCMFSLRPRLLFCVITEWVIFPPPTVSSSAAPSQLIWLFMFPLHHSSPLGQTVMRQGPAILLCVLWVLGVRSVC